MRTKGAGRSAAARKAVRTRKGRRASSEEHNISVAGGPPGIVSEVADPTVTILLYFIIPVWFIAVSPVGSVMGE